MKCRTFLSFFAFIICSVTSAFELHTHKRANSDHVHIRQQDWDDETNGKNIGNEVFQEGFEGTLKIGPSSEGKIYLNITTETAKHSVPHSRKGSI